MTLFQSLLFSFKNQSGKSSQFTILFISSVNWRVKNNIPGGEITYHFITWNSLVNLLNLTSHHRGI